MSNITDSEIRKLAEKEYRYFNHLATDRIVDAARLAFVKGYKAALQNKVSDASADTKPEEDLIYRIVENWGNAVYPVSEMVGWLKEYASIVNDLPIELFDLAFESWANKRNWQLHSSNEYYYRSKNMHSWPPDETIEIADLKKQFMEYISIVNEKNENIPADFKQITGHNSPKEYAAYEKGREDEQEVIMKWIEEWNGSSNSVMGALLKKKFNELFT